MMFPVCLIIKLFVFQWLSPPIHAETPHLSYPICTWYYTPQEHIPMTNLFQHCEYICSSQIKTLLLHFYLTSYLATKLRLYLL